MAIDIISMVWPKVQLIAAAFERSVGSVWFVRAIGNMPHLWHGQTMCFLKNVQTQLQSTVGGVTPLSISLLPE